MISSQNGSADFNDFRLILSNITPSKRPCKLHKNTRFVFLDSECLNDICTVFDET